MNIIECSNILFEWNDKVRFSWCDFHSDGTRFSQALCSSTEGSPDQGVLVFAWQGSHTETHTVSTTEFTYGSHPKTGSAAPQTIIHTHSHVASIPVCFRKHCSVYSWFHTALPWIKRMLITCWLFFFFFFLSNFYGCKYNMGMGLNGKPLTHTHSLIDTQAPDPPTQACSGVVITHSAAWSSHRSHWLVHWIECASCHYVFSTINMHLYKSSFVNPRKQRTNKWDLQEAKVAADRKKAPLSIHFILLHRHIPALCR